MRPKRVLIVDDASAIRQVIRGLLRSCGFEAVEASNATVALELMARSKFDLVLSDWNMPGMTGAEFVATIRARDQAIPVIMVTGEGDRQRVLELRGIGVNGYLLKPFKPESLLSMLKKIFPAMVEAQ